MGLGLSATGRVGKLESNERRTPDSQQKLSWLYVLSSLVVESKQVRVQAAIKKKQCKTDSIKPALKKGHYLTAHNKHCCTFFKDCICAGLPSIIISTYLYFTVVVHRVHFWAFYCFGFSALPLWLQVDTVNSNGRSTCVISVLREKLKMVNELFEDLSSSVTFMLFLLYALYFPAQTCTSPSNTHTMFSD